MIELRWITRQVKQSHGYPPLPYQVLQYRVMDTFQTITGEGQDCVVIEDGRRWGKWQDVPQSDAAEDSGGKK